MKFNYKASNKDSGYEASIWSHHKGKVSGKPAIFLVCSFLKHVMFHHLVKSLGRKISFSIEVWSVGSQSSLGFLSWDKTSAYGFNYGLMRKQKWLPSLHVHQILGTWKTPALFSSLLGDTWSFGKRLGSTSIKALPQSFHKGKSLWGNPEQYTGPEMNRSDSEQSSQGRVCPQGFPQK